MTTPALLDQLRRDEGLRLTAYPDPLTGGAPWTIGYGHTGPDVHPGKAITVAEAEALLERDVAQATAGLDKHLPWWRDLAPVRQDAVCNMAFNLGIHTLLTFSTFLPLLERGAYFAAGVDLLDTKWAREVGARAKRIARQVAAGVA